jgi:hypothetical protein
LIINSRQKGFKDYSFTLGRRVIAGWWSPQWFFGAAGNQFRITGVNADVPTISGNSITFRVQKLDDAPGVYLALFVVLYV